MILISIKQLFTGKTLFFIFFIKFIYTFIIPGYIIYGLS